MTREYYLKNREEILAKARVRYKADPVKYAIKAKKYRLENIEKARQYRENNKERRKIVYKIYYENNKAWLNKKKSTPKRLKKKADASKRYRAKYPEKVKTQQREWHNKNIHYLKVYHKKKYKENREKNLERKKVYYRENKEKILEYASKWRRDNKEYIREQKKIYAENNALSIKKRQAEYQRRKLKENISFRLRLRISSRIYTALKKNQKSVSLQKYLGCSIEFLKGYLANKFTEGMTWGNYGKWHIDHIKPCTSFDLSKLREQKKCFHYTNLQPLWAKDNIRKGCKIIKLEGSA